MKQTKVLNTKSSVFPPGKYVAEADRTFITTITFHDIGITFPKIVVRCLQV